MTLHSIARLSAITLLLGSTLGFLGQVSVSQSSPPAPQNKQVLGGFEILTDTEGVDFNEYLRGLYLAIKEKWYADMPSSAAQGTEGKSVVQFRILRDGTVPEDFLKLRESSERKELDEASLQAIRKAAPFKHLPEKYSKPFIELRCAFIYNMPKKPQ